MNTPTVYQWDYERNPWDSQGTALTFSVGVFQWLPNASGKGFKKSKSIRLKGFVAEPERVYERVEQLCVKLNREGVHVDNPPPWLQKQYALPKRSAQGAEPAVDDLTSNHCHRPNHKRALLAAFAPEFKQAGFKKKAATWRRANEATIEVFNVQCSQWSESYYFNAGIYLRALGSRETPLHHECHIRERIPNLEWHGRSIWDRWCKLCDFDPPPLPNFELVTLDPEARICELKKLVVPLALDWLGCFRKLDDIRRTFRSRGAVIWGTSRSVYQLLELVPPPSIFAVNMHDGDEPPPSAAE